MLAIEQIRQQIDGEVFNYTQLMEALNEYNKPRDVVTSLIKNGQIIRLKKGLYLFGKIWRRQLIAREMLANLIYGPSVVSLDFALAHYGLIPEKVETITSITNGRSRKFHTPMGDYQYTKLDLNRISFGNTLQKSTDGNWLITVPLKALFDKVWCDKRFKPTSPSSYSNYLYDDLRIDKDQLKSFLNKDLIEDFKKKFNSRKTDWLSKFLIKNLGK